MRIDDWRKKIDAIDTALLHLLNLRAQLAVEVGRMKQEDGVALRAPAREQEILSRMKELNPGPLDDITVEPESNWIFSSSVICEISCSIFLLWSALCPRAAGQLIRRVEARKRADRMLVVCSHRSCHLS